MRFVSASFILALLLGAGGLALFNSMEKSSEPGSPQTTIEVQPVNAVLGNESFRMAFGRPPTASTPERLRLATHLAVVERLLEQRDVSHLSLPQQKRRETLLAALHEYRLEGRFPQNTEVPGRTPIFIDAEGRLCAVGHLIAQSAGRDLARSIDRRYHFAYVRDIDAPALDRWATRNGFTRQELAMIQPAYRGPRPDPDPSETETASALEIASLSTSIGATLLNGALLERGTPTLVGGAAGVAGGATSFTVGLTDGAKYPTASTLAGAASVALGTWTLVAALRGDEASEPSPPPASAERDWSWQLAPATLTTVDGTTQPGVKATVRF